MDRIFKFGPAVLAVPAARIGVFLVGELGSVLVKGELFMQLCPLIDGRRSVGDLVQALQGSLSVAEVLYGVDWLAGQGHLIPVALSPLPGRAWTVEVVAPGQADPTPFAQAVQRAGGLPGEQGALRLVIVDDYLADALAAINRQALRQGQAWMLAKPGGLQPWWGPVFAPGAGPCWDCLATRLRANRPVQTFLQRRGDWPAQPSCETPIPPPAPASQQPVHAGPSQPDYQPAQPAAAAALQGLRHAARRPHGRC